MLKAPTHLCGSWKQEAVERLTKTIQEILDVVIRNPKDTNGLVRNHIAGLVRCQVPSSRIRSLTSGNASTNTVSPSSI